MAKVTTTPLEMIVSELHLKGMNEFFNKNHLTFFNDEFRFIKKVMFYDKDVQEIVNKKIFLDVFLENKEHDLLFKRTFILRFLNKQIASETGEIFASKVTYTLLTHYDYISNLYSNAEKYLNNTRIDTTKEDGNSIGKNRNAYQDLPQDEVNIDLNNDKFDYATNNSINKDFNEYIRNRNSESQSYNVNDLVLNLELFENVFKLFNKNSFLKIYT